MAADVFIRVNPRFKKKVDEIQKSFKDVEQVNATQPFITRLIADKITFDDINFFKNEPKPYKNKVKKRRRMFEISKGDLFGPMFKNE